jgi:hypothetical protein
MRKLVAIALLVLAALWAAGCSGSGEGAGEPARTVGTETQNGSLHQANAGAEKVPAAVAEPSPSSVPEIGPRIVQTASLRLSVKRGGFGRTIDDARSITAGLGGFVVSSSASQRGLGRLVSGTLVIRVPGRNYAQAMKSLAGLGRVEARQESGQDVSQEYVDLNARVHQLQAVESQLLELLDRAKTVGAALAVQQQLNDVQLDLEQAKGRLRYLDDQVALATISLDVHERLLSAHKGGGRGFGVIDVWRKAAHGFLAVIGWTFIVLATAAPLLVLGGLGILLGRAVRRRLAQA